MSGMGRINKKQLFPVESMTRDKRFKAIHKIIRRYMRKQLLGQIEVTSKVWSEFKGKLDKHIKGENMCKAVI